MSLINISQGDNVPDSINVIIEIPAFSDPVKYEVDKKSGALFVDRFMATAMYYPANYGYIPQTLSEDGDPVDALVITPSPLISGCVIKCRPIGLLEMSDESGVDAKILTVPIRKVSTQYDEVHSPKDVTTHLLDSISHFFQHYKDLEKGKWVKVAGWKDVEAAKKEILVSVERYRKEEA